MRSFRHPRWQHLDYRVKVATTRENKPPTQGTRQWTFTTPRWRCGSILLPSLNAKVPEPTGGWKPKRTLDCDSATDKEKYQYPWWCIDKITVKCCYNMAHYHIKLCSDEAEYRSRLEYTKIPLYLWGVLCEDFEENWQCYNRLHHIRNIYHVNWNQ